MRRKEMGRVEATWIGLKHGEKSHIFMQKFCGGNINVEDETSVGTDTVTPNRTRNTGQSHRNRYFGDHGQSEVEMY